MMRTQLLRERLFVVTAVDRDGLEAHLSRVLNTEMAQSTDAVNCDHISSPSTRVAQRVIDRNPGAHEWSRFFCRDFIRNRRQRRRRRNHVLSIAAIEVDPRDLSIKAHRKVATTTLFAHETMATMPADTNALILGPCGDVVADGIDPSSHFMTRHTRVLKSGPQTFFDEHLAMANPTRLHFH